eukprot:m.227824 g.227824  ORF g.227824 m.227824 type:complete len:999 (-) comp17329_c0_seq1:2768-5764(-)
MASLPPLRPTSLTWGDIPIGSPSKNYSWDPSNGPPSPEALDVKLMRYVDELQRNPEQLQTIEISERRFNVDAVSELLDVLSEAQNLETFVITKCAHLKDNDLEDLCNALEACSSLRTLHLEGLTLSEAGCGYVMDLLVANPAIVELSLARNQLSRAHLRVLENGLARADALQSLNLSRNNLNTKDAEHVLQVLFSTDSISYLDITRNVSIGVPVRVQLLHALKLRQGHLLCDDYTLIALLEKMEHSEGLAQLDFSQGHWDLDTACWKGFAHELRSNKSLVSLNMSNCELKPPVLRALATALKHNKHLKHLNLSYNGSVRVGCKHLCGAIALHPQLEAVKLSGCELSSNEAIHVSHMLEETKSIAYLGLKDNHLGTEGCCVVAKALGVNRSLKTLNLSNNHIDTTGARALASRLAGNRVLECLPIFRNDFGWEGLLALATMAIARDPVLILEMERVETAVALARMQNNDATLNHLELEYSGLDGPGMDIFLQSLQANKHLTSLDLRGLHFDTGTGERLYAALQANKSVTHLRLDGAELPFSFKLRLARLLQRRGGVVDDRQGHALDELVRLLNGDKFVTSLDLRGWTLDDASHKLIAKAVRLSGSLKHLRYDLSLLSASIRTVVLDGIRVNKSIEHLTLQMHTPDVQDRILLEGMLAGHQSLKQLILRIMHDDLSDEGVQALATALATSCLTSLRIEFVGMSQRGAELLLAGIAQLSTLTDLGLHGISWSSESGLALVEAVEALPSLTSLDVVNTCVSLVNLVNLTDILVARGGALASGFEDTVADFRLLSSNSPDCQHFELICPPNDGLYQDSLDLLCQVLKTNTNLARLEVRAAHLGDSDTARLIEAVTSNPNLESLLFEDTEIDAISIRAASDLLSSTERLVTLELQGSSENTETSCQPLVRALKRNRSLFNLRLRLPRGPVARRLNKLLRITPWRWFLHPHFEPEFRQRVLLIFALQGLLAEVGLDVSERILEQVCLHLSQLELRLPQLPRLLDE